MGMDVGGGGTQGQNFFSSLFGANAVQDPNASAYNQLLNQASNAGQTYQQQGLGYQQHAAQINNPYQAQQLAGINSAQGGLGNVAALNMLTAQGQGPAVQAAQNQMAQATGQNIASQLAMARSATGGASAQNAAQMAAQGNTAQALGQAGAMSAQQLAAQQLAAQQAAAQA